MQCEYIYACQLDLEEDQLSLVDGRNERARLGQQKTATKLDAKFATRRQVERKFNQQSVSRVRNKGRKARFNVVDELPRNPVASRKRDLDNRRFCFARYSDDCDCNRCTRPGIDRPEIELDDDNKWPKDALERRAAKRADNMRVRTNRWETVNLLFCSSGYSGGCICYLCRPKRPVIKPLAENCGDVKLVGKERRLARRADKRMSFCASAPNEYAEWSNDEIDRAEESARRHARRTDPILKVLRVRTAILMEMMRLCSYPYYTHSKDWDIFPTMKTRPIASAMADRAPEGLVYVRGKVKVDKFLRRNDAFWQYRYGRKNTLTWFARCIFGIV